MRLGDPVRVYEGEWFSEGRVSAIEPNSVTVDFLDWVQCYDPSDIRVEWIMYKRVLTVSATAGEIIEDYR